MINAQEIKEIVKTYEKYGWTLQRILLSQELKNKLTESEIENLFGDTKILDSKTNGALFSRDSKNNKVAWELRYLHSNPFAVFELIDSESSDSEKETIFTQMENQLLDYASNNIAKKDN